MCAASYLAIYLCFALPSALGIFAMAPPAFEHHQPSALNEAALTRLGGGDPATALILLERAAELSPFDAAIVANRDVLRSYGWSLKAAVPAASKPGKADMPTPAPDMNWPTLPALWPVRP
jgi:hypothetical protein